MNYAACFRERTISEYEFPFVGFISHIAEFEYSILLNTMKHFKTATQLEKP